MKLSGTVVSVYYAGRSGCFLVVAILAESKQLGMTSSPPEQRRAPTTRYHQVLVTSHTGVLRGWNIFFLLCFVFFRSSAALTDVLTASSDCPSTFAPHSSLPASSASSALYPTPITASDGSSYINSLFLRPFSRFSKSRLSASSDVNSDTFAILAMRSTPNSVSAVQTGTR